MRTLVTVTGFLVVMLLAPASFAQKAALVRDIDRSSAMPASLQCTVAGSFCNVTWDATKTLVITSVSYCVGTLHQDLPSEIRLITGGSVAFRHNLPIPAIAILNLPPAPVGKFCSALDYNVIVPPGQNGALIEAFDSTGQSTNIANVSLTVNGFFTSP